jgi:hypothetical protein
MNPSPPIIREAVPTDAADLASLMGELGYPVSAECVWTRIERMSSPTLKTLVAEIDGAVVGFVGCSALAIYESDHLTC